MCEGKVGERGGSRRRDTYTIDRIRGGRRGRMAPTLTDSEEHFRSIGSNHLSGFVYSTYYMSWSL